MQWAEFDNAFLAIAAADWTAAAAAMKSAIEVNGTAGYPHTTAWYVAHQGWLARLRGRMEEAIRLGHQAVELTEQHEVTWWQAAACAMLGDTVLLAGDRAEAIALFERGLAAARQAGVEGYLLRCAAPLAAATGSRALLAEAAGLLEQASIPDGGAWMLGYEAYLSLAEAWLGHGEPDRARAVLAPLLAVAEREPWIPALAAALAADGRALARLGQRRAGPGGNSSEPPGSPLSTGCRTCCVTCAEALGERSDEFGQQGGGPGGAVGLDRAVADRAADLGRDGLRQRLGPGLVVVQAAARAVPVQPVPDVEVLLEVMTQRHVDERPSGGGELHRGGQPALHHGQVAGCQVPVQVGHVAAHLEAVGRRQRSKRVGSIRGPVTTTIRSPGTSALAAGYAATARRSRSAPTPEPPTVTTQTCSPGR